MKVRRREGANELVRSPVKGTKKEREREKGRERDWQEEVGRPGAGGGEGTKALHGSSHQRVGLNRKP